MTDDHEKIYFQINQAKEAIAGLDKQVALLAQSMNGVVGSMTDHVNSHKENQKCIKTSAINFLFTMLGLAVAGGVGAVIAKFAGS